jgi:cytochrome c-type biogenesis protein CcmF
VLTSVHAFASDPTRGVYILAYLFIVVGGSLTLFALKAPRMVQGEGFEGVSRETMLLVNNLLLGVMAVMVLTGTLYPLVIDAFGAGKISVGAPYFGLLFGLLLAPLAIALPFGMFSRWRSDRLWRVARSLAWPGLLALLAAIGTALLVPGVGVQGTLGAAGGIWLMSASLAWPIKRIRQKGRFSRAETGMTLAHFGLGVFLIGVGLTGTISSEKHLRMAAGDQFELGGHVFVFQGTRGVEGPNYVADRGEFLVLKDGRELTRMYSEKRRYLQSGQVMTEAAIDAGLTRDLYVSLGEPLDGGQAWAVRLYHKPFVRWIWLGALFMTAGGLLASSDRRYRKQSATARSGALEATA